MMKAFGYLPMNHQNEKYILALSQLFTTHSARTIILSHCVIILRYIADDRKIPMFPPHIQE